MLQQGDEALNALAQVTTTVSDTEVKQTAREALDKSLTRLKPDAVAQKMKDKLPEMRAAAARAAANKSFRLGGELIDLLDDDSSDVRNAAHQSLCRLAG